MGHHRKGLKAALVTLVVAFAVVVPAGVAMAQQSAPIAPNLTPPRP
jgi:hypothetical protein